MHQGIEQAREIGRVVLAIAIEGCDPAAARMTDARGHRGTLARPRDVLQQPDFRHALRARRQHHLARPVGTAVVHENLLERVLAGQRGMNLLRQRQDILVLVADGDDDGNVGRRVRGRVGGHGRGSPAGVVCAAAECGGRRVG